MRELLLRLNSAPDDPIERLVWLGGVKEEVERELDDLFADAYFWARLNGTMHTALDLRLHSRKKAFAYTRKGNEMRGRTVKWNDGLG